MLNVPEWEHYLSSLGIPSPFAGQYAERFHAEQLPKSHIKHLTGEELRDTFGVKFIGHKLIIQHADDAPSTTTQRPNSSLVRHQAPQLKPSMSPSSFRAFVAHWQVYKKLVGISPECSDTSAQIFSLACNDHPEIRRTIADYKSDHLLLQESEYIEMLRRLLTARATPEAYRSKFFNMTQNPRESCQEWLKRLQEVVPDCDFIVKCDKVDGCTHRFDDTLLKTKFILGSYNEHIKQDLLAKSLELKTLDQAFNHATRMEATSLSLNPQAIANVSIDMPQSSSEDEEICKFSTYRKSKRPQKQKPFQTSRTPQNSNSSRCSGCGSQQHTRDRSSKCPAWNKTCNNCGKKGHFSHVCRSEKIECANAVIASVGQDAKHKTNEVNLQIKHEMKSQPAREAKIPAFADTGASLCVAGFSILKILGVKLHHLKPTQKNIVTATGNKIDCRGWFPAQLRLNNRTSQQNVYVCSNIQRLFLSKTGCIDLGIIHKDFPLPLNEPTPEVTTTSTPNLPERPPQMPFLPTTENIPRLKDYLLKVFLTTAFNNDKSKPFPKMTGVPKAHIHLPPDAKPYCRSTPNQVPHYWKGATKSLLDEFVKRELIKERPIGTPTPWCFPMVITPKKSNSLEPKLRMTIDFQNLNSQCQRELHHVESPFKLASQVPKDTYKTILDAVDGYQAVELDKESQDLTAFITEWGCFNFLRVPAGLIDSGDKYTSRYDSIIKDIPRKVKCVDDTLLYDNTIEQAFYHTFDYLSTCASRGIVLNASKFQFCKKEIQFAGFQITPTSIKPADSTLKAIRDFPVPNSITDIRSWFGLTRQVAYAYSVSDQLAPFRELLKHKGGQNPKFVWNEQLQKAFEDSKNHILTSVKNGIEMFEPSLHTCLQCDWSKQGIGFLLLQKHCKCEEGIPMDQAVKRCCNDGWKLIYAGSRFTNDAESRYSPTEGEALAVAWALRTSRLFTLGCPKLTVVTDHKPLLGILNSRDLGSIKNPRIRRIKEHTLEFHFDVVHCPGKLHLGADALSRHPVHSTNTHANNGQEFISSISQSCEDHIEAAVHNAVSCINTHNDNHHFPTAITLEKVELECMKDSEYVDLHNLVTTGFPENRTEVPNHCKLYWPLSRKGELSTFGSIVLYKERLVIPKILRSPITRIIHSAHQGCTGMMGRVSTSIYWPGIRKDIMSYQSNCKSCLEIAPSQPREPIVMSPLPQRPFQNICSDVFQLSNHYYLIVVDRFSGFMHIFHSKHPPTHSFIETHLRDIFKRYGRPDQFESDGGPQFRSHEFAKFLDTWGITHRKSSPYYAQGNGRAEAGVKSAKRMLQDNVGPNGSIDSDKVACAVLQYHNTPLQDGAMSPAQLLFGRALSDFLPVNPKAYQLHPHWTEQVTAANQSRELHHRKLASRYNFGTRQLRPLSINQKVLIQDQLHAKKRWNRTGVVIQCLPHRQYKLRLCDTGNITVRNRRFLKPISMTTSYRGRYLGPITGPDIPQHLEEPSAVGERSAPQSLTHPTESQATASQQQVEVPRAPRKLPLMMRRLRPFNAAGMKE